MTARTTATTTAKTTARTTHNGASGVSETTWARQVAIAIESTQVPSTLTDFTVALYRSNFPDEMFFGDNASQADGGDLRFYSDSEGTTALACDVERWELDTSSGADDADVCVHVKVPSVSSSADTTIYCRYHASAIVTQPAETAATGKRSAYDDYHCHVYHFQESPSDTAPQYKDSYGLRHLTKIGGTATQGAGKNGGYGFASAAAAGALSMPAGLLSPNNLAASPCTNTGLAYIPVEDILAVANFDDKSIIEINKTTGATLAVIPITADFLYLQGIAYDPIEDQYITAWFDGSQYLRFYERDGTFVRQMLGASNAVAYDPDDDALWVTVAGGIRLINKTTGAMVRDLIFSGGPPVSGIDGITVASERNSVYVTYDTGNMIYEVDRTSGVMISAIRGPVDIEHPAYDPADNILWLNADARFHSGVSGENVIYKLKPDGNGYDWNIPTNQYTIEAWVRPTSITGTTAIIANWKPSNAWNFEAQNSGGALRTYSGAAGLYSVAAQLANNTWRFLHWKHTVSTDEMTVYRDNVLVGTQSAAPNNFVIDGRLSIGSRQDATTFFNGQVDEVRYHRVARDDDWMTARYNNESSPATFAIPGTPAAV